MKNYLKQLPTIIIVLMLGIFIGIKYSDIVVFSGNKEEIKKISDVLNKTEKYYVDSVDSKKLVEDAINGMFSELDPHTVYISQTEQTASEEQFRGNFEGIGIEFQIINDTITVASPITGGPSEVAGIISGDRIVKINGKSSVGLTNEKVIKSLRGKKGTRVELTIFRPSTKKETNYNITRNTINLYSVDVALMYDREIGYVNVTRFSETTTDELQNALNDLSKKGMKKLILDLRNNPGGYLDQARSVTDLFLSENKLIVSIRGRGNELLEQLIAETDDAYENIPLIILVNMGSASASEIVAGAVQDWDRGLIVGETTFGKGLVQRPMLLNDNSAVRITFARYYTPSGRTIQRDYKDKKKYVEELMNQDDVEINNINHDVEKDSNSQRYKTKFGRTVYGNGGITPDYIIESGFSTEYSNELRKNNIYYQFVRNYLDKNGVAVRNKYANNLNKFIDEFGFNENEMKDMIKFAETNKVKFVQADYVKDKELIKTRLKAFVARDLFNDIGWYSVLLRIDNQFIKSSKLFDEAVKLPGFGK